MEHHISNEYPLQSRLNQSKSEKGQKINGQEEDDIGEQEGIMSPPSTTPETHTIIDMKRKLDGGHQMENAAKKPKIERGSGGSQAQPAPDPTDHPTVVDLTGDSPMPNRSQPPAIDEDADAASRLRDPAKELNDHEINKFLSLITAHKTQAISSHILESHQKWWKMKAEVAYVPLHIKEKKKHWFAGKIRNINSTTGSFKFMDSLNPIAKKSIEHMRKKLEDRLNIQLTDPENLSNACAQQDGAIDCGVYVLLFIWHDVLGRPLPTYVHVPWWRAILVIIWECIGK